MANVFVFALMVALAFQASVGKPADQQLSHLSQSAKNLAEEVSNSLGIQNLDSDKILKTINDQSKAFADGLQNIVSKLKVEVSAHQSEIDNVVKSVENQLSKTADDLKKSLDPKTQKQVEETRKKLDDGVKTAAAELDKLVKTIQDNKQLQEVQANIKSATKSALDSFLESVKGVENQIKKAIADHEKTHKH